MEVCPKYMECSAFRERLPTGRRDRNALYLVSFGQENTRYTQKNQNFSEEEVAEVYCTNGKRMKTRTRWSQEIPESGKNCKRCGLRKMFAACKKSDQTEGCRNRLVRNLEDGHYSFEISAKDSVRIGSRRSWIGRNLEKMTCIRKGSVAPVFLFFVGGVSKNTECTAEEASMVTQV